MSRLADLGASLLLAGCSIVAPAPTPTPTPDPVASFRAFVQILPVPHFGDGGDYPGDICKRIALVDRGLDVRVTDSLVSPYLGIATFASASGESTVTATYAFQGGEWVYKGVEVEGKPREWMCILRWGEPPP